MEGSRERTVPSASPNQDRGPNAGYGVGPGGQEDCSKPGPELRQLMRHAMKPGGKGNRRRSKKRREMSHGQDRIFTHSAPSGKNPETNGPALGYLSQSHTELRAGMAGHSGIRGTSATVSHGSEVFSEQKGQPLLEHTALLRTNQTTVPCVGISGRTSVLVH